MASPTAQAPPAPEQDPVPAPQQGASASGAPAPAPATDAASACPRCRAPLAAGQEWCLQCGTGAPGSLSAHAWRGAAGVGALVAVLVLGAAAAGYAALTHKSPHAAVVTKTVAAAVTPPAATTPATPLGSTATLPPLTATAPKIPLTPTKLPSVKIQTPKTTTPAATTPSSNSGGTTGEEPASNALVLDTNAASTYNPYNYPATNFGDPSLAIDGDQTTAWTAQVEPANAPKLAEGMAFKLNAAQKVATLQIISSTPGMRVQVYGAKTATLPTSITDKSWVALTHSVLAKKKHLRLKLSHSAEAFTYIVLWISEAPAKSVGTAEHPGHVDVNEVELFPKK